MEQKNPYLFDKNFTRTLTKEQFVAIKENNKDLFTLFFFIVVDDGDVARTKKLLPYAIYRFGSGKLLHSDKETGINTNHLGEKVMFLLLQLEKDPEARNTFNNSFFASTLRRLYIGTNLNDDITNWNNYKIKDGLELPPNTNHTALIASFSFYTKEAPEIGLDLSKMIDTIIVTDEAGNYKLKPTTDIAAAFPMYEAVTEQTRLLKNTPSFKYYFEKEEKKENNSENKNNSSENDDEENENS